MEEKKKKSEVFAGIMHKAADIGKDVGKKVADGVQSGTKTLAETAKSNSYTWKMKKYNPVFPEQYWSKDFYIPNMIVIVDDAVRRGIDVCKGSIGWLSKENGMEVLYLYDEFVSQCGIIFVPAAICDEVYYVDRFDHKRFVRVDCIFGKAHEEKLAELEHIAFCLGAKSFSVEISESSLVVETDKKKADGQRGGNIKGVSASTSEDAEKSLHRTSVKKLNGRNTTYFEGNSEPRQPQLKWFAHDDGIKRLIEMRCSKENTIKSKVLELEGSSCATMAQKTACAIDGAIGKIMNNKSNVEMEHQAKTEWYSKLIYRIEF